MKMIQTFLLSITVAVSPVVFAEIYQWKDENGKVHFSDSPPPDAKAEKKELQPINVGDHVEIDEEAKRRARYEKIKKNKDKKKNIDKRKDLAKRCKKLQKKYVSLKGGEKAWSKHTVLTRDGKSITRREQNEIAEKFRDKANSAGCNIKFKKY